MILTKNVVHPRYATVPVGTEQDAKTLFAASKHLNLSLIWLSLLLNAFLCGIFTFQVIKYWSARHNDKRWVKACVWWVTVLVYGSWIVIMYYAWWTYTRFLDYFFLSTFVLLDAFTAAAIQAFFTYRTFRLNNRNWYLVGILSTLICTSIAGATSQGVIYIGFYEARVRGNVLAPIVVWTCASMGADLIITFSILWGLYRTRTGWHHNDKVIYRLIRMTLEAQAPPLLLTSVYTIIFSMLLSKAQLTPAVIYLTHQLSAYINNSKLNAIGLMYSLNSRAAFMHHDVSMANPGGTDWRISQMRSAGAASTTLAGHEALSAKLFGFARKSAGAKSDPSKSTLVPSEHIKSPRYTEGPGDPLSSVVSKADPLATIKKA